MDCSGDASFNNVFLRKNLNVFGLMDCSGDVRARIYGLRDISNGHITSGGIYFGNNVLNIDSAPSSSSSSKATSIFFRTMKTDGSFNNVLKINNTFLETECPDPSLNDNTKKLTTTSWVTDKINSISLYPSLTVSGGQLRANTNLTVSGNLTIEKDGEAIKMVGNHNYITGNDSSGRIWCIGKEISNQNKLFVVNGMSGELVLRSGSIPGNTMLGQNKIITYSNGIQFKRGETETPLGEIGLTGLTSDYNFYIKGSSPNNVIIDAGIGNIQLVSNTIQIGSGTPSSTGKKSNMFMYDSSGNWEIQSSAFTETIKNQIVTNTTNISRNTENISLNRSNISVITELFNAINGYLSNISTNLSSNSTSLSINLLKLQNITATSTETTMNKPLHIISPSGEIVKKMVVNHNYITGNDSSGRIWYIGTPSDTSKNLFIGNEKSNIVLDTSAGNIQLLSALDMVSSTSERAVIKSRFYKFRDVSNGSETESSIYQDGSAMNFTNTVSGGNITISSLKDINLNSKNVNVIGTMDCSGSAKFKDVSMNGNVDISGNVTVMSGYKTRLRDTSVNNLDVSGQLIIRNDGEAIKMVGNYNNIAGYDSSTSTRDWYIGTRTNKNLNIINENEGQIVMYSGRSATNINRGTNKINTYSGGLQFHRGGASEIYGGEIGLTNSANNTLNIVSNGSNDIYMVSGSGKMTLETTNEMFLNTNIVKIGSGIAGGINNRKSNILMLDSIGQNFETQSSAFTETLKTQIGTNATNLQNITASSTETTMSKPLKISTNGDAIKMIGNHNYISGNDLNGRIWYIGTPDTNSKILHIYNLLNNNIQLDAGTGTIQLSSTTTSPTPSTSENSTVVATTAWVTTKIANIAPSTTPTYTSLTVNGHIATTTITATGQIKGDSFNATSDYRIKQNVQSIDASDTILNLNPQKYLKNDKLEYGFLAHEIQETFPTLVTGEKDGKEMQTLNYLGLISILVKDVQRLHKEIVELKEQISKK